MPHIAIIFILALFAGDPVQPTGNFQEDPTAQCLKKTSSEWGSTCGSCYNSTKSYRVNLKNVCTDNLDVKVAVQERANRWRTFNQNNLAPGDSISSYACEGTGKYIFWTRKTGDKTIVFPTDEEINKEFSTLTK
jgi:hypothetical protein